MAARALLHGVGHSRSGWPAIRAVPAIGRGDVAPVDTPADRTRTNGADAWLVSA